MNPEWFIEMPPAIIKRILCAMALPMDKSIPTERDRFVKADIDRDRLPAIGETVSALLQEISRAEFANSWMALTQIRATLDRVLTKLRSLRAILVANDAAIIASITGSKNVSQDRQLDPFATYVAASRRDALRESGLWSSRSSAHPRRIGGASPMMLASIIADAVADLKHACDYAFRLPNATGAPIAALADLDILVASLVADLEYSEFSEALRLAAANLFAEKKYRGEPNTPMVLDFNEPKRTVEWTFGCIGLLFDAVNHLDLLIEEYESNGTSHDHPWLAVASHLPSDGGHHDSQLSISPSPWSSPTLLKESRRHLAAFLKDGRSTAPGTILLLSIADLYEFIFDTPFNLYVRDQARYDAEVGQAYLKRSDNSDLSEDGRSLGVLDYEINDAMKFACSVIKVLGLEGVISRYGDDDVGFDPEVHGLDELPTKYDIQRHQRLIWTNAPDRLPDFLLVCKLGDIWKQSRKRNRKTAIPT